MSPLVYQIMGYKKQIETRLAVLNSLMKSKDNLQESLDTLEQELRLILYQRSELDAIIKNIEGESSVFTSSLARRSVDPTDSDSFDAAVEKLRNE